MIFFENNQYYLFYLEYSSKETEGELEKQNILYTSISIIISANSLRKDKIFNIINKKIVHTINIIICLKIIK